MTTLRLLKLLLITKGCLLPSSQPGRKTCRPSPLPQIKVIDRRLFDSRACSLKGHGSCKVNSRSKALPWICCKAESIGIHVQLRFWGRDGPVQGSLGIGFGKLGELCSLPVQAVKWRSLPAVMFVLHRHKPFPSKKEGWTKLDNDVP